MRVPSDIGARTLGLSDAALAAVVLDAVESCRLGLAAVEAILREAVACETPHRDGLALVVLKLTAARLAVDHFALVAAKILQSVACPIAPEPSLHLRSAAVEMVTASLGSIDARNALGMVFSPATLRYCAIAEPSLAASLTHLGGARHLD